MNPSTTLAAATTTIETWVYETSTSLCPVTEVQTISGAEVTVVYTSTSLIVQQVPTTIIEYAFLLFLFLIRLFSTLFSNSSF
jgi:hypothetical protein